MPALTETLVQRAGLALQDLGSRAAAAGADIVDVALERRINIPYNSSSPPGLIQANTVDPFSKSAKYALGWVYFCIILLVFTTLIRIYHLWTDKMRSALQKEELLENEEHSPDPYEMPAMYTDKPTTNVLPPAEETAAPSQAASTIWAFRPLNLAIALTRYVFYRNIPVIRLGKKWTPISFPSLGSTFVVSAAFIFVTLYCFVPQPLYWQSIQYGSPPLAIRAGMIAVAMMPWIIATSMKANLVTLLTGIGHERLNVLHRWAAYICLFLSLVHMIPFYVTPVSDAFGLAIFQTYFNGSGVYIYGTGIAALVPLIFLCLHSLPILRRKMYELFVSLHVPVSIIYLAMLFWHCKNYLTSWQYLYATVAIWLLSYALRLFYLNWTNPWRLSWLIGEEAAVTILPENAVKITIPTQTRWRPGQYVYLRMPGVSWFENHPFTVASLCSEDFPSEYGESYRDMTLVFRPFGGFTRKVVKKAEEKGPWHTYRAFIDGPYGGTHRDLEAFDTIVLIAGGSGITAVVSQLLHLIKRMRDGKAVTKHVQVIWAMKRPETMEWFKEELRICRQFAPPESVQCQFYITSAKRQSVSGPPVDAQAHAPAHAPAPSRSVSDLHDKVNDAFQGIANKRQSLQSFNSSKRNSAFIRDEAANNPEKEAELRAEIEDKVPALPQAHIVAQKSAFQNHLSPPDLAHLPQHDAAAQTRTRGFNPSKRKEAQDLRIDTSAALAHGTGVVPAPAPAQAYTSTRPYDFGFPSTPTEFQKNLMRFAFLPASLDKQRDGWSVEYGRPDIAFMLRQASEHFGRRTCVFVCGPPGMRLAVSNAVADLQRLVWAEGDREEVFLYAENYAL